MFSGRTSVRLYFSPSPFLVKTISYVLLMPKFHYIYLAQNLQLKTRSPTCRRQVRDQKSRGPGLRQDRSISTCRDRSSGKFSTNKKVRNLVSDLSATWSPTSRRPGLRQDRSNGIWALGDFQQIYFGVFGDEVSFLSSYMYCIVTAIYLHAMAKDRSVPVYHLLLVCHFCDRSIGIAFICSACVLVSVSSHLSGGSLVREFFL